MTRLLLRFAKEQADIPLQLPSLLASGNLTQAIFLLHSLKGLAGNLGATILVKVTNQLMNEIKVEGQWSSLPSFVSIMQMGQSNIARYVKPIASNERVIIEDKVVRQSHSNFVP